MSVGAKNAELQPSTIGYAVERGIQVVSVPLFNSLTYVLIAVAMTAS
jgi:hypothetical protein